MRRKLRNINPDFSEGKGIDLTFLPDLWSSHSGTWAPEKLRGFETGGLRFKIMCENSGIEKR